MQEWILKEKSIQKRLDFTAFLFTDLYKLSRSEQRNSILTMTVLKTRHKSTKNRMRGMQGVRGMFTRTPGNLLKGSGECYHFNFLGMFKKIFGNVREDVQEGSGECSRRFRLMFQKNLGNVIKDLGNFSRRFRRM